MLMESGVYIKFLFVQTQAEVGEEVRVNILNILFHFDEIRTLLAV